jgi:hypothetical protein
VREDGRIVGGEGWQEKVYNRGEWKKLLRKSKELSHSAHINGVNEYVVPFSILGYLQNGRIERTTCVNHSLLQTGKMSWKLLKCW